MKQQLFLLAGACMLLMSACSDDDDFELGTAVRDTYLGYEYVDLGLPSGTMWASCNVGDESENVPSDCWAWGMIWAVVNYYPADNEYCTLWNVKFSTLQELMGNDTGDYSGNADYDVATAVMGGKWRTPTIEEWEELVDNTTSTWYSNLFGRVFKSNINGNYIFLRACGYWADGTHHFGSELGYYWSSTPSNSQYYAYSVMFGKNSVVCKNMVGEYNTDNRYFGMPIRPVFSTK